MLHIFPLTDNEKLEIESLKYIFGRNLTYFMKLIDAKLYFRKKGFFLIIQHDTPYLMSTSKYQEYRIHTIDNIKIKLTKSNTPYIMYDFFGFNEPYEKKDIEEIIYNYGIQNAILHFVLNKRYYNNIIELVDNDENKVYIGIAYYIITECFDYILDIDL